MKPIKKVITTVTVEYVDGTSETKTLEVNTIPDADAKNTPAIIIKNP